jgi:hypothetical protein
MNKIDVREGNNMEALAQAFYHEEPREHHNLSTIETSFYGLIAAINEEVRPEEDWLVTAVVLDLIRTKRVRCQSSMDKVH